ncbi:MAG: hypothetical protein HQL96_00840 [Magnetococcales bacterium]|nr:hypothetical protein [Magnetococcales bacterium]
MTTRDNTSPRDARSDYALLDPVEQRVLQFLSILREPTHRTQLAKCLRLAGVMGHNGKAMGTTDLSPMIERMQQLQLLAVYPYATVMFSCAPRIACHATRDAIREKRFTAMVEAIRGEFPYYKIITQKRSIVIQDSSGKSASHFSATIRQEWRNCCKSAKTTIRRMWHTSTP